MLQFSKNSERQVLTSDLETLNVTISQLNKYGFDIIQSHRKIYNFYMISLILKHASINYASRFFLMCIATVAQCRIKWQSRLRSKGGFQGLVRMRPSIYLKVGSNLIRPCYLTEDTQLDMISWLTESQIKKMLLENSTNSKPHGKSINGNISSQDKLHGCEITSGGAVLTPDRWFMGKWLYLASFFLSCWTPQGQKQLWL